MACFELPVLEWKMWFTRQACASPQFLHAMESTKKPKRQLGRYSFKDEQLFATLASVGDESRETQVEGVSFVQEVKVSECVRPF